MAEVDYQRVLADLEGKRERIVQAIAAIRELAGMEPETAKSAEQSAGAADGSKVFAGVSVAKAAEMYLSAQGKWKSSTEIARALKRGGYKSETKGSFTNVVYSRLFKYVQDNKVFAKQGKGSHTKWGLKEWAKRDDQLRIISSA